MKSVIFGLIKGYPENLECYEKLINRNISIYEKINKHREIKADLILFHEGNISNFDQNYIQTNSPEIIKFIDVGQILNNIKKNKVDISRTEPERFNLGYRFMCQFNFFHIWRFIEEYSYALRIDEDIIINDIDPFIFEEMQKTGKIFSTGALVPETHELTNQTLPQYLENLFGIESKEFYNHKFPYTNVYVTNISFWLDNELQKKLEEISENPKQIEYRWGDLPILGSILNIYDIQIDILKTINYEHLSHKNVVKSKKLSIKNYNIQAFTSISSLLNNINEKINIHVIHPNENIESLFPDLILKNNNINEINFYKFDNTNLQFPNVENSHVSEATYYRFYIEKYIPQRYKFLVYLDADILTINNPLNEIKKTILLMKENDVRISVKTEFYINSHTIDEVFSRLPLSSKYFNAGVMIINYDKWINENTLVDLLY